jgi:mRNA-degrading endonuclease RelE of RelBE toxin-antitoxin system
MSTDNQEAESGTTLSVDDLEAALRLLSAEERVGQTDWHKLIAMVFCGISFGIIISSIPIGLLVVWFDQKLGLSLLAMAVIAFIVFGALVRVNPEPDEVRATLGESLSKTTKAAWEKRSDTLYKIFGLLSLPILIGLGWLIYSLVNAAEPSLPSLALIAFSLIIIGVLFALDQYREAKYLLHISRLRDKLESRLKEVSATGSNEVPLSSEELNLLSQVETRVEMQQVVDKVAQVKLERPDEQFYSIAIAWEPLNYFHSLAEREPEARIAIREAWDELQTEPKPPEAQSKPGRENEFALRRGHYDIIYRVDDQKHRIDVVKIQEIHQEEPLNAS